jgi:hypothetical protein
LNDNGIPAFEDLPLRKNDPHHSAWGLYGERDELGTLNRLTGERVVSAARSEVRNGTRCVEGLVLLAFTIIVFVLQERYVPHPKLEGRAKSSDFKFQGKDES